MFDPHMLRIILFNLLLVATCGYAIWRGGAPERITGYLLACAVALTILVVPPRSTSYMHLETGIFLIDVALLAALVIVAFRADRFWPIVLAALQLDTAMVHLLKLIDVELIRVTYKLRIAFWAYPMQIVLAIGTLRHQQRLRRFGEDRSWSIRPAH